MDGRLHGAEKEKWRSVWPLKFSRKEVKRPKSGFRKNYLEGTFVPEWWLLEEKHANPKFCEPKKMYFDESMRMELNERKGTVSSATSFSCFSVVSRGIWLLI